MKWSIALIGFFVQAALAANDYSAPRNPKISLFNIVKFKNDPCTSTSTITGGQGTGTREGTCLTEQECNDASGVKAGGCAQGFGVCCVFIQDECNSVVSENCTYAQIPTMIPGNGNQCPFTVRKCDSNVCALRLDFVAFNTLGPANTEEVNGGACRDQFIVTSDATGFTTPTLCGDLTGQHIYVPLGPLDTATATLTTTLLAGATDRRTFEAKISQISCNSKMRPPDGCLQWYTGTDGQITSFNFEGNTGHLATQNYNICIRKEKGFCCVKYSVCTEDNSFNINSLKDMAADMKALDDELCAADYIRIEGSSSTCGLEDATERYCGQKLADVKEGAANLPICDCTAPFQVGFVSDNMPDAKSALVSNRGFCLDFVQTPCGSITP